MDIQDILATIIVAIAIVLALRHLWRIFHRDRNSRSNGCSCGCDGCSMRGNCHG